MDSVLSPMVANFYIEKLEKIGTTSKRPKCWLKCMGDSFVVWQYKK